MKRTTASRVAWTTCALTLAMIFATDVLAVLNPGRLDELSFSIVGVAGAAVGGVLASKRPDNPVGWLFLFGALISAMTALTEEYAIYGILTDPGTWPAAATAAWFSRTIEILYPVLTFILMPLYFPTGRPVSRRWGLVAWLVVLVLLPFVFLGAFSPGEVVTGIQNPLVIEALRPVARVLDAVFTALYLGLIFASAASLIVRFWRSAGVERQQIKWVAFAAAFIPIWFMTNAPVQAAFPTLFQLIDALVIAAVPVAAGVAILRYRLYDIDVIINKTLVYGVLTATLVLIYLGGVVVLQRTLSLLTGAGSQLAVVASTLAIAALFNPLRRRIQGVVDRHFYRRKYDAARTLETFSARLRDETDLDDLSKDLVAAVRNTVQPAHVSLWLRTPPEERTR